MDIVWKSWIWRKSALETVFVMRVCTNSFSNQIAFYNMKESYFRDCIEVLKKDGKVGTNDLNDE